ncbi:LOW QUALITY PROTEIN: receptor-type tyrosine-protein phosphatase H [Pelodytes ibericus]
MAPTIFLWHEDSVASTPPALVSAITHVYNVVQFAFSDVPEIEIWIVFPNPAVPLSYTSVPKRSAVTNFTAVGISNTSVLLTWQNPPNDTNYSYNITVMLGDTNVRNIMVNQSSSTRVDNLDAGVNYEFKIYTVVSGNVSSAIPASATTQPNIVSDLSVTSQTNDSVSLSWKAPNDKEKASYTYSIDVSPEKDTVFTNATEKVVNDLRPGINYTFTITTVTTNNVSSTDNPHVEATTYPSAVSNVKITSTTTNNISLSWLRPNDLNNSTYSYVITVSNGSTSWNISIGQNVNSAQVSGLQPGVTYTFTIYTQTINGILSSGSAGVKGTTNPSAVSNVKITSTTTNNISLSWLRPNDLNSSMYSYVITVSNGSTSWNTTTGQNVDSAQVSGLQPGVTYTFTIYTQTINGILSLGSATVQGTTNPSNIFSLNIISRATQSMNLSWTPPSDVNKDTYSYIITVSSDNTSRNVNSSQNSLFVDGLQPGVTYTFTIYTRTTDGTLSSGFSSNQETTRPSMVGNVTIISHTTNSISLSWSVPSDINKATYSYVIIVSNGSSSWNVTSDQNANSQQVPGLQPGLTYTFTVYTQTVNHVLSAAFTPIHGTTNPSAVDSVVITGRTNDSMTLSWSSPGDQNKNTYTYAITVSNGSTSWNVTTVPNASSKEVDNLSPGVNYTFMIYTQTINGFQSTDKTISGTTTLHRRAWLQVLLDYNSDDVKPDLWLPQHNGVHSSATARDPNKPLAINGKAMNTSAISVSWVPPQDPNFSLYKYLVTWISVNGMDNTLRNSTVDTTRTDIIDLSPGTLYNVSVQCLIGGVSSGIINTYLQTILSLLEFDGALLIEYQFSSELQQREIPGKFRSPSDELDPTSPVSLTVGDITSESIVFTLSWPPNNNAIDGFQIQATTAGDSTIVNITDRSVIHYTLKGLTPGNFYTFSLKTYKSSTITSVNSRIQRREVLSNIILTTYSEPVIKTEQMEPAPASGLKCFKVGGGYALQVDFTCPAGNITGLKVWVNQDRSEDLTNCTASTATVYVNELRPANGYQIRVQTLATPKQIFSEMITCRTDDTGVIVGAIFGVLLFLLLIGLVAFFILRKRRVDNMDYTLHKTPGKVHRGVRQRLSSWRYRTISKEKFSEYFEIQHADSDFGFAEEYQELSSVGTNQLKRAAEMPDNRAKNRFTNVLPYDHSRVKLDCIDGNMTTDYINANYMPGYNSAKEFIASQGPLPNTTADFWRMVWGHHINTIVMLTNCLENGRVKCEHYWPLDYTPCTYGDITVTVTSETILPEWTIRDFSLKHAHQPGVKCVRHYHFTSWPDHGVPENTSSIVEFRNLVRENMDQRKSNGPSVVHCSAGVGRTGTLIALDYLIQQMEKEHRVGIYGFVEKMRLNRPLMVQTESQYVFLNKCLLSLIQQPSDEENIYENQKTDLIYENASAVRNFQNGNA